MRCPPARLVPPYLLLQAIVVGAWWLILWFAPAARPPFVVADDWPQATLLAFALPDVLVLVAGSLAAAAAVRANHASRHALVWLVAGAAVYATLWCAGAVLATGSGWLSLGMMLPCAVAMAWAAAVVR